MRSRIFVVAVAVAVTTVATLLPGVARAQDFPAKPLTIIVPNAAGGSSEIIGRLLAQKLTTVLGQPVLIIARPGGNGVIGMDAVLKAAPDGYTMLLGNTHNFVRIYLDPNQKMSFSSKDFLPVTMIGETPLAIVANPKLPVRTLKELIDYARANPGKISFGAQSSRSFEMDMIRFDEKIDMTSVPYPGGSGEIVRDLIGGHIQLTAATTSSVISQIRSGAFRAIALMSDQRDPALPDLPTVVEAGFPQYQSSLWFGISVPAATPRPIVDRLNAAFATTLADPELKKQMLNRALIAKTSTSPEFQKFIDTELTRWRKVAETVDVKR